MKLAILEMVIGVGGFVLLGLTVSWWGAVGVYLMIFGNNIGHSTKMM